MATDDWNVWVEQIRNRDESALAEFWSTYAARLVRLADAQIQASLRRRVDADDIVQSAIRTFFRRTEDNQFEFDDDQQLWALLCAITRNKARLAARHHLREKRGVDREHAIDTERDSPVFSSEPQPEDAMQLLELIEGLLDETQNEHERQVLQLKFEDIPNEEIADRVGCSERTVRRLLQRVRERLERQLAD